MPPEVVNMRTCSPPWGQPGDIRIDRATYWGNPFRMDHESERGNVINEYEEYLRTNQEMLDSLPVLASAKRLGCWCKPKLCHGDVLVKLMKERRLV